MDGDAEVCSNCSHPLETGATACPECGQEVSPEPAEPEPQAEQTTPEATETSNPKAKSKRSLIAIILAVVVVFVVIAGAVFWWTSRHEQTPAQQQYDASASVLTSTLADMAGVRSTQMVRDVADTAAPELESIDAALESDGQESGVDELTTMRDAFAAIVALNDYTQTNTKVWPQNRGPLIDNLNALSSYGGSTADASAQGDSAVSAMDDLTKRVDDAMARYKKQLDDIRAKARAQRYDLDAYYSAMDPLVTRNAELTQQAETYIKRLRTKEVFNFEVSAYFSKLAAERRDIANQMAGISAPYDLYEVNSALVAAATASADSTDAGVTALNDAACDYGECYFEWDKSWREILPESTETRVAYDDAYKAWESALMTAEQQATGEELPQKPNL